MKPWNDDIPFIFYCLDDKTQRWANGGNILVHDTLHNSCLPCIIKTTAITVVRAQSADSRAYSSRANITLINAARDRYLQHKNTKFLVLQA